MYRRFCNCECLEKKKELNMKLELYKWRTVCEIMRAQSMVTYVRIHLFISW